MRPYSSSRFALLGRSCAVLVICALFGAALLPGARAATRDYYFTQIGSDRGLRQNTVTAMVQDSQGFVWVGTQGGLHRYDGQRYVSYRHDPRDPASLPDSFITALALEGDRALWVGSYSQFVSRIDLSSGEIRRFAADSGGGQAGRQVMALLPQDGKLWIGTGGGLERFDPATGERRRVLQLEPRRLHGSPFQQLLMDRAGNVWWANAAGLFRIDESGQARLVGGPMVTHSLLLDREGRLWAGRSDGLFRLDDDGILRQRWPRGEVEHHDVRAIAQAPDGALWLSVTGDGLRRFDPADGSVRKVTEIAEINASLPEDSINTLMIDHGGMLWVGGQFRGVAVTDPRGSRFSYILNLDGDRSRDAAADDSVRAVHEGTDGVLWIGTDNARLLRYDILRDRFEDWTSRLPRASDGRRRRVMAIAGAGHDRLWLATDAGLLRLESGSGLAEVIGLGEFTDANLRSLLIDREGNLWLGTNGEGALHFQRGSQRVVHYSHHAGDPRRLAHPTVHALLEDRDGRVWFGTGDGLDLLDTASGQLRHFGHEADSFESLPGSLVRALHEDRDGTVWVGTHAGLSRVLEGDDGEVRFQHPLAEALEDQPVPAVFAITSNESSDGQLWLGTGDGIIRFDPRAARARAYDLADGLQDLEFNGGAVASLGDGRIALGGVRGLNLFDPARMRESSYVPPLRLLSARIGADAPSDAGVVWQPFRLEVPDGADILRLRIGALDFAPAATIRYRYRMEGFDKGWIDNGTHTDITYTRLPPGEYVFRAQATNRDGVWGTSELRVPVEVAPPLWRHPLAAAAAAVGMLILLGVLGWRWHSHRQREQGWFRQIREREERLKLALWASGEQFWDYDLATRQMHRMRVPEPSGARPEITVQSHVTHDHIIHDEDLPHVLETMRQHLRGEIGLFMSEHRTRNGNDEDWQWVRARGRVVGRGADGRALRVAGTARDITASRSAERERRISSEVLRSMAEAVAVFDRDFTFASVNPAFTRMTGYSDIEVIGHSTSLLDSTQHDPGFYRRMREEMQRDGRWSGEIWQQRKDGNEFLCWLQASAVAESNGQRGHYVAVLSDITDQKRAEQELRYLANYDTLTNLPNRTLLSERLSRAIARARSNGRKTAVLFLDLDRFKDINDSLGHAAGDRILRAAANRLQQTVGADHTVARLGGDEFTVILEDIDDIEQAEALARELITAFEAPLDFDERHNVVISPSIGVSLFPDHAQGPSDLLKHADTAMYQAKAIGRRTFMRYTDTMDIDVRRRATISAALRKVLDSDELSLAFQPRLSLADDRITGLEALLRWHSAEHGEITPMQFIPLAEETGLILEVGEWALREACLALKGWRERGLLDVSVAVNVSALQLLRGNLPDVVARVLAETGIPANCLELELTESVIMTNAEQTATTLQAFRKLGVNLAVDDFGTGYSSLAYLKRLPITTLKIDKEFIADLCHDPDDAALTSTIITMAHSLGLNVVAEGVETEAQVQFLRTHGCDEIQGYWLARPMPPALCLAFLNERAVIAVESG